MFKSFRNRIQNDCLNKVLNSHAAEEFALRATDPRCSKAMPKHLSPKQFPWIIPVGYPRRQSPPTVLLSNSIEKQS